MLLTFPRYILAEFNTHRMFSRNSASSRAIPFKKVLHAVHTDPFIPMMWMKDHKGMQGSAFFTGWREKLLKFLWILASKLAIISAWLLNKVGLTKQMCNRILEPFMWHLVIVTATEWENFFAQRANDGADIHMQALAYDMLTQMNRSSPRKKIEGEWHIPFEDEMPFVDNKVKVATAWAARISYTTVGQDEKKENHLADIKLHDKLWAYPHPSPFEHCAKVPTQDEYEHNTILTNLTGTNTPKEDFGWFGNFHGWIQYRKLLPNENQSDSRLQKGSTYREGTGGIQTGCTDNSLD